MAILQMHYTSLASGPDGRRGFQVSASTGGISPVLEDAAIKASAYRAPAGAASETPEEIDRLPVSLGYTCVDGKVVLYQSRYVGQDFAGRQGNYFAHALVTDTRAFDGLRPIDTWRAPSWDQCSAPAAALPPLSRLQPGSLADQEAVDRFLRGGRLSMLAPIAAAVQSALVDPRERVVLVCTTSDEAAAWIAAVTHALPRHLALAVTFTTFSAAPLEADVMLIGTVRGVTVGHDPFRPQTIIDLTREHPKAAVTPYAACVAEAWAVGPARVQQLVTLAEAVHSELVAEELDVLADVHLLLADGTCDSDRTASALEFTQSRLAPETSRAAMEAAARLVEGERSLQDADTWGRVIDRADRSGNHLPSGVVDVYARDFLERAVEGSVVAAPQDAASVRAALDRVGGGWALDRLRITGTLAESIAVLTTLTRSQVRLSAEALVALVDAAYLPAMLTDPSPDTADLVAGSPHRNAVLDYVCRRLEQVLSDPGSPSHQLALALPTPAARLLHEHGQPGPALRDVVVPVLVAAGELSRIGGLAELVRRGSARTAVHDVDRWMEVLWVEPPTAEEAVGLFRILDTQTLARTSVPDLLVQRLLEDAKAGALSPGDADLADQLLQEPVGAALGPGRSIVEAVRWGAYFRGSPTDTGAAIAAAQTASLLIPHVGVDVSQWLLRAVVDWTLQLPDPIDHVDALASVHAAAPGDFLEMYVRRAAQQLPRQPADRLARIAVTWATFAVAEGGDARLVERTLPEVVRQRRKRELDDVGQALERMRAELDPVRWVVQDQGHQEWSAWWSAVREANERPSAFNRIFRRRRTDA
ncbi:GAP1-N2 domain-containing protein [Kineococcus sp. SYSU DK005]|uniref:GAP1-N2 domain-containing protein n=1 Tax=Kineococcus sp. SYSU DK005 TaxID=3383126 RepID=UPI003D7E4160